MIPDSSYTDGFWMDAEDEGLGRHPLSRPPDPHDAREGAP